MYLQQGSSIVIDRTNMKAKHRRVFSELAKTHNASCSALVFGDPHDKAHFDTCFARIASRTNHATLNASSSPKKIRLVLSMLRKSFEPISVNEHFDWQHI
jgi:predicted kinase